MPNNCDFSEVLNLKSVEVNPEGWITPLFVEYGMGLFGGNVSYFWRVNGTFHTFIIPITRMDFLSEGNYVEHFNQVLRKFREDYIEWAETGFSEGWMQEYRSQFASFIAL